MHVNAVNRVITIIMVLAENRIILHPHDYTYGLAIILSSFFFNRTIVY